MSVKEGFDPVEHLIRLLIKKGRLDGLDNLVDKDRVRCCTMLEADRKKWKDIKQRYDGIESRTIWQVLVCLKRMHGTGTNGEQ